MPNSYRPLSPPSSLSAPPRRRSQPRRVCSIPRSSSTTRSCSRAHRVRSMCSSTSTSRNPKPPPRARLQKAEWLGALGVFLWVFCTTFPLAIPFIFIHDVALAMRVSNGIGVAMLFVAGFAYGRSIHRSPWLFGLSMVGLGSVLVALTMALGG